MKEEREDDQGRSKDDFVGRAVQSFNRLTLGRILKGAYVRRIFLKPVKHFVLRRSRIHISARRPAILRFFLDFQYLKLNAGILH
jgi:hypothetical protein